MAFDKNDKRTLILFFVLVIAVVGLLIFMLATQFGGNAEDAKEDNVTATIPDGEARKMTDSKSEAFRGRVSTEEYFENLGEKIDDEADLSLVSSNGETSKTASAQTAPSKGEDAVARTFGAPPASSDKGRNNTHSSNPSRAAGSTMTREEKLEYDRQRAVMVRDVLTGGSGDETTRGAQGDNSGHSEQSEESRSIDLSAVGASDGIITSLDDDLSDAAVEYTEGVKRPFKCMFVRDQKLVSGQRVTLRLMEDYVEGGVRIPANTHLAAICKIGDRLELQVRSLEMNGRIVPLALDAYDTDGLQGIYCPETSTSKNSKKASQDAISTAGTTFGGLVGDLANTVIRTGASIARSASGELSVNVVSGYEFYLVKAERR